MFDGLIGQRSAKRRLQSQVRSGAVRHAYLFEGTRGLGKLAFAFAFSKAAMCSCHETELAPCGACDSCRLFGGGGTDDFLLVDPPAGKPVTVDEARAISDWAALRPMYGARKACVVADADRATAQAQNAMLKTLEEPPANVVIILTASQGEALLPTVRSRCETVRFARYGISESMAILASLDISEAEANLAARASGGAPGLVGWGDGIGRYVEERDAVARLFERVIDGDPGAAVDLTEAVDKNRESFLRAADALLSWIRDIWVMASRANGVINADRIDELASLGKRIGARRALAMASDVAGIRDAVARNANLALAADALILKLAKGT